jgi:PAS domain S-box-containing protein
VLTVALGVGYFATAFLIKSAKVSRWSFERFEMNDRYRLVAELSPSGVYLIQENLLRYVNPAMARMFGYAVEEMIDRLGPLDLVYPDDRPLVLEKIRRRIEGEMEEIRYECRGLRKDGSAFPVEVYGRRIEHDGRIGIVGTLLDNTDHRRARDELRASEQRFRDYSEIVSDWFWESGPDHRFSRISGKPPDQAIFARFIGSYRWDLAADVEDEPEKWRARCGPRCAPAVSRFQVPNSAPGRIDPLHVGERQTLV